MNSENRTLRISDPEWNWIKQQAAARGISAAKFILNALEAQYPAFPRFERERGKEIEPPQGWEYQQDLGWVQK